MNKKVLDQLNKLTLKELKILKAASSAIYFDDNSDYDTALWEVISILSNDKIKDCDSELYNYLNRIV